MSKLSTHVLDTARGRPAAGVAVVLSVADGDGWRELARTTTNADGRTELHAAASGCGFGRSCASHAGGHSASVWLFAN